MTELETIAWIKEQAEAGYWVALEVYPHEPTGIEWRVRRSELGGRDPYLQVRAASFTEAVTLLRERVLKTAEGEGHE